ncbi:MAG TPA: hypothetical protein VGE57_07140 [Solimonas sp.]
MHDLIFAALVVFGVTGAVFMEGLLRLLAPVVRDSLRRSSARRRGGPLAQDASLEQQVAALQARLERLETQSSR